MIHVSFLLLIDIMVPSPLGSSIPALDDHVSSLNSQQPTPLRRGDVVEIQGPAASGKSHLLYHLLTTCVLPVAHHSVCIGGWECAAVLLDTDGKFNIKRFRRLLTSRLSKLRVTQDTALPAVDDQTLEDILGLCLSRLHVFRPSSSAQLAATLVHLPDYHSTHPSLRSHEIGLLAIDSLSAFYWGDRFLVEQWRTTSGNAASTTPIPTELASPMRHVVAAVQRVRALRGPLTVLTNWGLNPSKRPADLGEQAYPLYKQHLHPFPAPFDTTVATALPPRIRPVPAQPQTSAGPVCPTEGQDAFEPSGSSETRQLFSITHHITLYPSLAEPYPASLTLSEIKGDSHPSSVIAPHTVTHQGLVRTPASVLATRFAFRVTEDDIVFEPSAEV
ncbi:hypothetical protein EVJ58_g4189 [Rhodofomes roseus]|uniref:DNA recombination and repair protein Rad51-like C-terminal domain-containing protein n=1 Tax=Rhodofomes roseus TaxID=34475 RepID=A0A4Y9YIG1_9APHY|nr:hypothetical protein EVJ58_g4189 [Rhodofomes roseus]